MNNTRHEVVHHTEFLKSLLDDGRLTIEGGQLKAKDYISRSVLFRWNNNVYEAPELIQKLDAELVEMKRSRANGLCCGAGGAQMFKDAEAGDKEINIERTEDALETKTDNCCWLSLLIRCWLMVLKKRKEGDEKWWTLQN
jgi:Fe-S oxidoreductase